MTFSKKQLAILSSLYKDYISSGVIRTFVAVKGVSSTTMKSLYKTQMIDSDRVIKDVPCNARLNEKGIAAMKEYFDTRKKTVDSIISRNKHYIRFVQNTEEKRIDLKHYIEGYPLTLIKDVDVTHCGYGVFEVIINHGEPHYYGVYTREEANNIEVGGCITYGKRPWYFEKVKLI
jgi:hypothetical protein